MKKQFESTIEEEIEQVYRAIQLSRTIRTWRRRGYYVCVPALALIIVLQILDPPDLQGAIIFSGVVVCGLSLCYYGSTERYAKRRIRKFVKEKRGTVDPRPAEVEMDDARIVCRDSDLEIAFNWAKAESVEDRGDYIEIIFEPNTPIHLPKKIFKSEKEQTEWLQFIRDRISPSAMQKAR